MQRMNPKVGEGAYTTLGMKPCKTMSLSHCSQGQKIEWYRTLVKMFMKQEAVLFKIMFIYLLKDPEAGKD